MRDPNRIPHVLAALERRWRQDPDWRLGQLLANVVDRDMQRLFAIEDDRLVDLLQPREMPDRDDTGDLDND